MLWSVRLSYWSPLLHAHVALGEPDMGTDAVLRRHADFRIHFAGSHVATFTLIGRRKALKLTEEDWHFSCSEGRGREVHRGGGSCLK